MTRQDRAVVFAFLAWHTDNYTQPVIKGIDENNLIISSQDRNSSTYAILSVKDLLDDWKREVHTTLGEGKDNKKNRDATWRKYLADRGGLSKVVEDFQHMFHHVFMSYINTGVNR